MKAVPKHVAPKITGYYGPFEVVFIGLASFALADDITDVRTRIKILDEAEKVMRSHPLRWKWRRKETSFLGLAIQSGLTFYVEHVLKQTPSLIRTLERPLLDHALNMDILRRYGCLDVEMIEVLLNHGADPNEPYKDSTVWGRFLSPLPRGGSVSRTDDSRKAVQLLLLHRARLGVKITIGYSHDQELYLAIKKPLEEILAEKFGSAEAKKLLAAARWNFMTSWEKFLAWVGVTPRQG